MKKKKTPCISNSNWEKFLNISFKVYGKKRQHHIERIGQNPSLSSVQSPDLSVAADSVDLDSTTDKQFIQQIPNVLENYELVNLNYTKGISITQCTLAGNHQFSLWEFSGYEPYQIFYDRFVDDCQAIHMIVYNLNQEQRDCFDECLHWVEYLRSRLRLKSKGSKIKIIFVATRADLDKTCCVLKKDDGYYSSEKSRLVKSMLESFYNQHSEDMFDLSEAHFVLDSRAAWTPDVKLLIESLIRYKQDLCNELPYCTMFLNRTLYHIQMWRKQLQLANSSGSSVQANSSQQITHGNHRSPLASSMSASTVSTPCSTVPSTPTAPFNNNNNLITFHFSNQVPDNGSVSLAFNNYPIISWKQFAAQIRESINPLASDDHLNELLELLQLMGEVVYVEGCFDNDMICYQPEWLCGTILGRLFSHERYSRLKPSNLNGFFSLDELKETYADICSNINMLIDIFLAFDLCTELERQQPVKTSYYFNNLSGQLINTDRDLVYEFPAFNFLSEPMPLAFHTIKAVAGGNGTGFFSKSLGDSGRSKLASANCFVFNGFQIRTSSFHVNKSKLPAKPLITGSNLSSSSTNSSTSLLLLPSQLASLFFKLQVHLRYLANNSSYLDTDEDLDDSTNSRQQPQYLLMKQHQQHVNTNQKQRVQSKLENFNEESSIKSSNPPLHISPLIFTSTGSSAAIGTTTTASSASCPNTANSTVNILPTPPLSSPNSVHNYQFSAKHYTESSTYATSKLNILGMRNRMNGALIDIDLFQTRYCTRLNRKSCLIECMVSLDHRDGDFIEVKACAPEKWREELFYFVQDLYSLIEQVVAESCCNLNLEKHYMHFKPVQVSAQQGGGIVGVDKIEAEISGLNLGVVSSDAIYSPKDIINLQLDNSHSNGKRLKFVDLVCCGSEQIERNLIYGVEMAVNQLNEYTRHMLCAFLDKTDPMGRDWSIFAFLLGLQDHLPKLDEAAAHNPALSKCNYLLDEWCRQTPEQATVRNLLCKVRDLGRKDVYDMIQDTADLFKINICKDSGIQNSNQTLASLK